MAGKAEGRREVVEVCYQVIADEPEFPGEMPDELWDKLNGHRGLTTNAMRNSVRLTKQGITKRLQAQLKEWGIKDGNTTTNFNLPLLRT